MRTRTLGKSGLSVGEIGLGTWGISGESYGPVPVAQAEATIAAALDAGCTFVDTADCYALGATETQIGAAFKSRDRSALTVCTRVGVDRGHNGPVRRFDAKYLTRACEASLQRLGVDYIDILALHNPSISTLLRGEAFGALRTLRDAGKIRLLGASVGSVEAGRAAVSQGADALVLPYNLLFPKVLHGLSAEIVTAGVAVIVRSPLAYGLLADTWGPARRFDEGDHRNRRWLPAEIARRARQREKVRALVHDGVTSMRDAALRYVLSNGLVSVAIPGARTADQARQNAQSAATLPYLPDSDMVRIGTIMAAEGI